MTNPELSDLACRSGVKGLWINSGANTNPRLRKQSWEIAAKGAQRGFACCWFARREGLFLWLRAPRGEASAFQTAGAGSWRRVERVAFDQCRMPPDSPSEQAPEEREEHRCQAVVLVRACRKIDRQPDAGADPGADSRTCQSRPTPAEAAYLQHVFLP